MNVRRQRARAVPFVVLTSPRSGSGWLVELLDSHPAIAAYAELFERDGIGVPSFGSSGVPYFRSYVRHHGRRSPALLLRARYLSSVFSRRDVAAVGFKLMAGQLGQNRGLLPELALRRVRVVHLVRVNTLDALVSYAQARSTGVFHPRRRDEPVPVARVRLDPRTLLPRLEAHEHELLELRKAVDRLRLPRLDVYYEELASDPDRVLTRILLFLGVAGHGRDLESDLVRSRMASRSDVIENVEEVRAALAGSRFAWMLDWPEEASLADALPVPAGALGELA